MSWKEVKKINSNLKKPLDRLIPECLSSVKTKIETEAKTPKTVVWNSVYVSASEKTTATMLEVTQFKGGKLDFYADLYAGNSSSTYYPELSVYVNGTKLTDTELSICSGEYSQTGVSNGYMSYIVKELWLPSNSSIKVTIQTKNTFTSHNHIFKYRLIGF